jgi:hypothetical protein
MELHKRTNVQTVCLKKHRIFTPYWVADYPNTPYDNKQTFCYLSAPAVSHIPNMNFLPFVSASLAANAAPMVCQ